MDQRLYDEDGNTVLHLATYTNQYQIIKVVLRDPNVNINAVNADGYNASAISEMNTSSSEFDIRAQSLQRGGSSDQQAAGVLIITASNGRSNEEQQHQILDDHSSRGAGDHSSDKAKDYKKELVGSIKNGIFVLCSLLATFCLEAILSLPGGSKWEQLQSKPMNYTKVGQLYKYESFLYYDGVCFVLSVTTIFLVTISCTFHYKYSLYLESMMTGTVIISAIALFYQGLVLATNDRLANIAFHGGIVSFFILIAVLVIAVLWIDKEPRSFIRKGCSKIRDLITELLCRVHSWITRQYLYGGLY